MKHRVKLAIPLLFLVACTDPPATNEHPQGADEPPSQDLHEDSSQGHNVEAFDPADPLAFGPAVTHGSYAAPQALDSSGVPLPPGAVARFGSARLRHGAVVEALAASESYRYSVTADGWLRMWNHESALAHEPVALGAPVSGALVAKLLPMALPTPGPSEVSEVLPAEAAIEVGSEPTPAEEEDVAPAPPEAAPQGEGEEPVLEPKAPLGGDAGAGFPSPQPADEPEAGAPDSGKAVGGAEEEPAPEPVLPQQELLLALTPTEEGQGIVERRDPNTLELLTKMRPDVGRISALAVSPDGYWLAVGGESSELVLMPAQGADEEVAEPPAPLEMPLPTAPAEGEGEVALPLPQVVVRGRENRLTGHEDSILALCFGADRLYSLARDGSLRSWNLATGEQRVLATELPTGAYHQLVLSQDGQSLALFAQQIYIWKTATGEELFVLDPHKVGEFQLLQFVDNENLLSASGDTVELWNPREGRLLDRLSSPGALIRALSLDADGATLAIASDTLIELYDSLRLEPRYAITGHRAAVRAVAISADTRFLATGALDRTIRIWEAQRERLVLSQERAIVDLAFAPGKASLLSASPLEGAVHWQLDLAPPVSRQLSDKGCRAVAFNRAGQALIGGSDGSFRALTLEGEEQWLVQASGPLKEMSLFVEGETEYALLSLEEGILELWQLDASPRVVWRRELGGVIDAISVGPGGIHLSLWQQEGEGIELQAFNLDGTRREGVLRLEQRIDALQRSPDGELLVGGDRSGALILFELEPLSARLRLPGHLAEITDLAFFPDAKQLISVSADTTALLWSLGPLRNYIAPFPNAEAQP